MATSKKLTAGQERALAAFMEKQGDKPFRRQDLAAVMYPLTTPRSHDAADRIADVGMQRWKAENRMVKAGHVHWRLVVSTERVLKSGRAVPELPESQQLELNTRCPQKWVSIDLETGEVWVGSAAGWKRADAASTTEAINCLAPNA